LSAMVILDEDYTLMDVWGNWCQNKIK